MLLFNIRNKNRNINLDLNINNIKVKQFSEIKLLRLGVIIDCKFNWKLQLNYVSSKLSRTIVILHS